MSDVILHLQRLRFQKRATLGTLKSHDGSKFYFTLEDGPSPNPYGLKVAGETRIPAGVYELKLIHSPLAQKKAERWPNWHRHGIISIEDVPGFTGVRIHEGNDHTDTAGCPLLGFAATVHPEESPTIQRSVAAYQDFYTWLAPRLAKGETALIIVGDEPVGP